MLTFTPTSLQALAGELLARHPDPVPRFRLLRDVLGLSPADPALLAAQAGLQESRWVRQLEGAQLPDGTWGRFHSRDSRKKQPFPTTEIAITTALDCGLDKDSVLLRRAEEPLAAYVEGRCSWPDPAEKHDNPRAWAVWVRHFSAAVLGQVNPFHPLLDEFWNTWAEVVQEAFQGGNYDRGREIAALNRLLGCRMKDPVPLHKKYPLLILSSTSQRLPATLERSLLEYLLHFPAGIYYVYDRQINTPVALADPGFWNWMRAHALLSRFPMWRDVAQEALNTIWAQRNDQGLWDPGTKVARKPYTRFPLSESWQRPGNRTIDASVEVLTLLARGFDHGAGA